MKTTFKKSYEQIEFEECLQPCISESSFPVSKNLTIERKYKDL
jgi:hypothetical protein